MGSVFSDMQQLFVCEPFLRQLIKVSFELYINIRTIWIKIKHLITFGVDLNSKFNWNPFNSFWDYIGWYMDGHDLPIVCSFCACCVKNT